jgi:hypothetical protein
MHCLRPAPSGNKGQGLIEGYHKDPQKFKHYAEMLETEIRSASFLSVKKSQL